MDGLRPQPPAKDDSLALQPPRTTWIEVEADALANNARKLRRRLTPGCKLMAVVKANAYGHGAVESARVLQRAGVDWFAVATFSEARELRAGGINLPLLVLGYTPPWQAAEAAALDISLTLFDQKTGLDYALAVHEAGQSLRVHVKVNTGMNRLGVDLDEATALLAALAEMAPLTTEGIFTHFATSDEFDKQHAYRQFARFQELLAALDARGLRPPLAHCANSAALLTMPDTHLDMARSGIALYGLDPDAEQCTLPDGFRPALTWKALLSQVRRLEPGDAVSYGREFVATHAMVVGVVPVGYADGFPRRPYTWEYLLVGGQPAPILGRVCMDQVVVDVSSAVMVNRTVAAGDEVVILGRQGDRRITAEDAAARVGTNNYDVVSRILPRVPRLMTGNAP